MTDNNLKTEILNSVDDSLIANRSREIKLAFAEKQTKPQPKTSGIKWGFLGAGFAALACAAVVIPLAVGGKQAAKMPETVNDQINDISFGVASISGVLSATNKSQSKLRAREYPGYGDYGYGYGDHGYGPEQQTMDYLGPVEKMYEISSPFYQTVDGLLNGAEFTYKVEASGNEKYPFKLGNFIFNIVEDKEAEGEITEEEPTEEETGEGLPIEAKRSHHRGEDDFDDDYYDGYYDDYEEGYPDDDYGYGDDYYDDYYDDYEEPTYTFVEEFYRIEGILTIGEEEFPVTGQQATYTFTIENDVDKASELFLNVKTDDTHETSVFKSTYEGSFSNTFRDESTFTYNYVEETYAYYESELETTTDHHGHERTHRNITSAIEISTVKDQSILNDETLREDAKVYLALESSYVEDEVENTISADLYFRLPKNKESGRYELTRSEEEVPEAPVEGEETTEETPVEEETPVTTKAFRVDYDCRIIKDVKFEKDDYGYGQYDNRRGGGYHHGDYGHGYNNYITVEGAFYVYKDAEGNLLKPDFETEGRHNVHSNGYHGGWFESWDW